MAVLKKEEFFERIKRRIGDDDSDDALTFVEDVTDTYNELESRNMSDGEDWRRKYEDNDKEWRRKYKERFFTGGKEIKEEQEENVKDDGKERTYKELFEEREG